MENNRNNSQVPNEQEAPDILARAKANSKLIVGLSIFVLVVLIGILAWFFIAQRNSAKADEAVGRADVAMAAGQDSVALTLYKEAAELGHKSGNRAKLEVAMQLYNDKDYQGALTYLKDASIDDNIVAAGALTLEGDCYVNLKQYPEAIKAYDKAIKAADNNPLVCPQILVKKANVLRATGDFAAEAQAYNTILEDYPQFLQSASFDVRKYYERAKAAAENK
ncbi:MAG: tetratricopeptide repeat protein [Odoribacter sp.]|nr:tetratricopeptide repeat protein [Odoribacter sp.]